MIGTTTHKKQNKAHTKTKWNNYPLKQKNIAKNYKQNETKRENHTQKNYFLLLTYRKNGKLKNFRQQVFLLAFRKCHLLRGLDRGRKPTGKWLTK